MINPSGLPAGSIICPRLRCSDSPLVHGEARAALNGPLGAGRLLAPRVAVNGALCAINGPPRQWQPEDLAVLGGLAPTAALHLHADAVSDAAQTPARLFV